MCVTSVFIEQSPEKLILKRLWPRPQDSRVLCLVYDRFSLPVWSIAPDCHFRGIPFNLGIEMFANWVLRQVKKCASVHGRRVRRSASRADHRCHEAFAKLPLRRFIVADSQVVKNRVQFIKSLDFEEAGGRVSRKVHEGETVLSTTSTLMMRSVSAGCPITALPDPAI